MKITAFYVGMGLCFSLGCSDKISSSDSRPSSSGGLSAIVDLCSKVESFMKRDAPDIEACKSKLSGLKEKDNRLFLEVAKCIKNASNAAKLKPCNDRDDPRYPNVATEHRSSAKSPQVAIQASPVTETNERQLMTRLNALTADLKSSSCPGKLLNTCSSPRALNLKARLKQMIAEGMTDDEIMIRNRDEGCTFDPKPCRSGQYLAWE